MFETVVIVSVNFAETPRIPDAERAQIRPVFEGGWRVTVRFGFMEIPDRAAVLAKLQPLRANADIEHAMYISTRDFVVTRAKRHRIARWRAMLFAFLYRNAARVVDRFGLPPDQVAEISREIAI